MTDDVLTLHEEDGRLSIVPPVPQRCVFAVSLLMDADAGRVVWSEHHVTIKANNGTVAYRIDEVNMARWTVAGELVYSEVGS